MTGRRYMDSLDEDINDHIEREIQDNIERGMSPGDARQAALRRFGSIALVKEDVRAVWLRPWLDVLWQDVRYAVRSLRRQPAFTGMAILTLALGIGANTAIFSVVNAVLLRPLNAPAADRIVRFVNVTRGGAGSVASIRQLKIWRAQQDIAEDVSAHRLELVNLTGTATPEQIPAGRVSTGFFNLFGASVVVGRTFTADEDRPGGDRVVVLSYEYWARRFGSDPTIVGQRITLSGAPHLVVGVIGPGFDTEQFDERPDIWIPFQLDLDRRDNGDLFLVSGRLKPGTTRQMADAQLRVAFVQYVRDSPWIDADAAQQMTFAVRPLRDAMTDDARGSLFLLFGAVTFVLLIACVNVANLVLVRGTGRRREIAIRAAIGAGRSRVVRQLLTESLLLAAIGGAVGLVLGAGAIRTLLMLFPSDTPFFNAGGSLTLPRIGPGGAAIGLDWRVVTFTILLCVMTAVVFGLAPALQASRADLVKDLKDGDARTGQRRGRNGFRSWLVISEIALATLLLIGSVLLIRTFVALHRVNPGFDIQNVTTLRMSVAGTNFEKRAGLTALTRDGVERLRAVPGVIAAGATCCLPLDTVWQLQFVVAGRPLDGRPWHGFAGWTFVSPGYFDVLRIPLVRGRTFTDRDVAGAPGVAIINQAMARIFWKDNDPLNDQLMIGRGMRPEYQDDPVRRIIGIVGDVRDTTLNRPPRPAMYVPMAQVPDSVNVLNLRLLPIAWLARTDRERGLNAALQKELERVSNGLPVARIRSMAEVAAQSTARTQFMMSLMSVFAASALLLAAVGVYGVTAYSVQQRTHDIGVRLALGATAREVGRVLIAEGMRQTLIGIAIGLLCAFAVARVLTAILFDVTPRDPAAFLIASTVLAGVALVAVWGPVFRVTRIDPVTVLRHE